MTAAALLLGFAVVCGVILRFNTPNRTIELVELPAGAGVLVDGKTVRSVATPKETQEIPKRPRGRTNPDGEQQPTPRTR